MNFTTSMKESGKRFGSPGGVISWHAQYSLLAHALETFYSNIFFGGVGEVGVWGVPVVVSTSTVSCGLVNRCCCCVDTLLSNPSEMGFIFYRRVIGLWGAWIISASFLMCWVETRETKNWTLSWTCSNAALSHYNYAFLYTGAKPLSELLPLHAWRM